MDSKTREYIRQRAVQAIEMSTYAANEVCDGTMSAQRGVAVARNTYSVAKNAEIVLSLSGRALEPKELSA